MLLHRLMTAILLFTLFSCSDKKQQELEQRERQLLLRENELTAKEEDYKSLIKMRDSLYMADSIKQSEMTANIAVWPDSLAGAWNSRMICRETTCTTYVIGDQRTERWIFAADSLGLMVQVMDNEKIKRQLKAALSERNVSLHFPPDTVTASKIKIDAKLDEFKSKVIKGTQTITNIDGCKATFSVELTRVTKK